MRYIFESALAPYIEGLIEQKRADGFIYTTDEKVLKRFDAFCKNSFPDTGTITYELAAEWSVISPTENKESRGNRIGTIRQLGFYMLSLGMDAYVPRSHSKGKKPILYIPTREEMAEFFREMDAWKSPVKRYQRFIDECKMMCLLYYCCGMRVSEARLLKKEHIDWDNGILAIYESKGRKDRFVYLPQDGAGVLAEYLRGVESLFPDSPWVFPGEDPSRPITTVTVENLFRKCWAKLPSAANANRRPTPRCLRHSFVVDRLNDWMMRGMETRRMIAYLSKHLGHKSPSETFYYYHLVKKAFAIVKQKDKVSGHVIPEVVPYEEQ